jgi:hypothetical protein
MALNNWVWIGSLRPIDSPYAGPRHRHIPKRHLSPNPHRSHPLISTPLLELSENLVTPTKTKIKLHV